MNLAFKFIIACLKKNKKAKLINGILPKEISTALEESMAIEYLQLSCHGLRAKRKSFYARMKMNFDETIGKINIIPQEIGRVLLNLINNAFYAAPLPPEGGFSDPNYLHNPTIWLSTKKDGRPGLN